MSLQRKITLNKKEAIQEELDEIRRSHALSSLEYKRERENLEHHAAYSYKRAIDLESDCSGF